MSEEKKKQAMAIAEDYKIMFDAFKEVGFSDEQAITFVSRMTVGVATNARTREAELDRVSRIAERRARRVTEQNGGGVNENISR